MIATLLAASLELVSLDQRMAECKGEPVKGRYTNYAQGFSVGVPHSYRGLRPLQSGPERGISIALTPDCSAFIVVFSEADALDGEYPQVGLETMLSAAKDADPAASVHRHRARLGSMAAAAAMITSWDLQEIEEAVVALRPGGGLVYKAELVTTAARHREDRATFARVLRGFRLEPWR